MRKVYVIFRWMSIITVLFILLVFTNNRQDMQKQSLDRIIIKGVDNSFVDKISVLDYLQHKLVRSDSIFSDIFSKQKIEMVLESHPNIKQAEVFTNQKGNLGIVIEQKKAVVRVKTDAEDYYLDEFGVRMSTSENYTPRLLVATGNISASNRMDLFNFVKLISKSDFWSSQITQIHFEENNILLIPSVGDHKIHLGSFDNIIDKLDNLYHFYKTAIPIKGWQAYTDINLKFKNQIVCTKK